MGLFDLFKKTTRTGADSTVNSSDLTNEQGELSTEELVETTLSFHPDWNVPKEQEYVLRFLSNELAPLLPNQISLSAIDIDVDGNSGDWYVKAFFRSSLSQEIGLEVIELLIISEDGQLIARKEFDLSALGTIPAKSNRPWIFQFEKSIIGEQALPADGWQLAFNVQSLVPHQLDLAESWEQSLPQEQKNTLTQLVSNLPKLGPNEINLTGLQIATQPDESLAVSVFIRNGHKRHVEFQQIPLEVRDAADQIIARGSFQLENFQVKANTSKPWTFIFPKDMVLINNPDVSKWSVRVMQ